ncbi:MAG: hypothetical protein CVU30_02610 [Betaproteobacteria bacterium HGW-Betaproteobacteria-3]|jgi:uncharacterized membrane-anchored protein YitT (DUF2179 family)|nr:MAG: hypothetical protein CVU30_02610 [Betaproteobacteria bacterium HGW-Betaproteobacteria-3]
MNTKTSVIDPATAAADADADATAAHHRPYEDLQALVTGTVFVALGLVMFGQAGLLTGGTAGLALLLHYSTGQDFALMFFGVNLPFYVFAWLRMGVAFTLKTFAAVSLLSLFAHFLPRGMAFAHLAMPLAAVLGGLLCGAGMLMLFRHRASLGGMNVLVLYLQDKMGWRAGKVQMVIDSLIVLAALAVTDGQRVAWSVLGAVVMNLTLAINHRPGRYLAV